jgi:hypothetical protein
MSQERPDNDNWQKRLSEVESISGEAGFNKATAWNRLHNRLNAKQGYKRKVWYFGAAACLIGIVCLPILFNRKTDVVSASVDTSAPVQQIPIHANRDTGNIARTVIEKKPGLANKTIRKSFTPGKRIVVTTERTITGQLSSQTDSFEIVENELPQSIAQIPASVDTVASLAFQSPSPPKKLNTIHINEIESPASMEPSYATLKLNSSAREKHKNKDSRRSRSSTLTLSKNASDDLVKIQLSPSN